MVEGGLRVQLLSLHCLEAGGSSDEVFAKFNGIGSSRFTQVMCKGFYASLAQTSDLTAPLRVRLHDKRDNNAIIGSFLVTGVEKAIKTRVVSGSGSRYEVTYNVRFQITSSAAVDSRAIAAELIWS